MNIANVDYDGLIPNNVALGQDVRVKRALEKWHPGYINWWNDMGPEGFQESLVYLRTAVSVDPKGWAKFDYVRMPEYRWGVLLAPQMEGRKIPFGRHKGEDAWQEIPGEYRAMLRRLLGVFNEKTPDWLSFFMFTYFTDRDGKMQLEALAQSGFDPLSRTCRFMLTEEAHHMFVGETGVTRVVQRTCEAMKEAGINDPTNIEAVRKLGVIDLPTIQKKE